MIIHELLEVAEVFTSRFLHVKQLCTNLCSKTLIFTELLKRSSDGKPVLQPDVLQSVIDDGNCIIECGLELVQYIQQSDVELLCIENLTPQNPVRADVLSTNNEKCDYEEPDGVGNTVKATAIERLSDSGIDVASVEDSLQLRINLHERMNGVASNNDAMKSVLALRDTLRRLKRLTDKAVVEFLVRSRDALQKQQHEKSDNVDVEMSTHANHDFKLVDLISIVLIHKREADKQMTEMESPPNEDPLSVLEKSLCYILVDKALLNCLLLLDKAISEGKIVENDLDFKYDMASGKKVIAEFSEAISHKRDNVLQDDIKSKSDTIEKLRDEIRTLSSDKQRLENENKSLHEQNEILLMKSEELGLRNTVIEEERQLLKEKVSVLDESMAELQSCTQHLRQQLQTLESREEEAIRDNLLLKERLQSLQEDSAKDNRRSLEDRVDSGIVSFDEACSSTPLKAGEETRLTEELQNDNKKLQSKVEQLENQDQLLREEILTLKQTHNRELHDKREQICQANDQNKYLREDLESNFTEIVLLKARIVELQKINDNAKTRMLSLEGNLLSKKSENIHSAKDPTASKQFMSLNKGIQQRDIALKNMNERLQEHEIKAQNLALLLEELVKRNETLVTKLEMLGAVTVIKNQFDVPDGYQEAIDGMIRTQSATIEKGVVNIVTQLEKQGNELISLEEENKRMINNTEAVETENVLLKIQVSDLTLTIEELEEDLVAIKSGAKLPAKRSRTGQGGVGHRVTFDNTVGLEKDDSKKLQSLIENAKGRCIVLERQIRYNTSVLKATQYRNEVLVRDFEILQQHNCQLKKYLTEFHHANQALSLKVSELEEKLKGVDEKSSLDEMEKQSLADRLKIMEGHTKYLKEEKDNLSKLVEILRQKDGITDGNEKRYSILEADIAGKIENEAEKLKNKAKQQAARSRIFKCEIFEFLDDVRFIQNELRCAMQEAPQRNSLIRSIFDGALVSTWSDEKSLCQQEGMGLIMSEIIDVLKLIMHGLVKEPEGPGEVEDNSLRSKLQREMIELKTEKQQVQREVFALKAVFENLLEDSEFIEKSNKVREEQRCRQLRKQILSFVQKNSQMEVEIFEHLKQQLALEDELNQLKESILNIGVEKDILLTLQQDFNLEKLSYCTQSEDKEMRDFCFVKQDGQGFEQRGILRVQSENDDVFSCQSDEGMYHSPTDREASSCDSGYHEGQSGVDRNDPAYSNRYLPSHSSRTPLGSFYENTDKEGTNASATALEKKPKGILKKRSPRSTDNEEDRIIDVGSEVKTETGVEQGCKVCNITDIFKPFKRTPSPDLKTVA